MKLFVSVNRADHGREQFVGTVVGANLCVRRPLEVKGKGIIGVGQASDKEAYTVHSSNIITQRQCFVPRCLSSFVGNVSCLHSI
jgi:hypothetical protein